MKKALFVLIAFFIIIINNSISQTKYIEKINSPKKVFDDFFKVKIPQKDDFETWADYLNRLPKCDTNKIYNFVSKAITLYDIESKTLTIAGPLFREKIESHYVGYNRIETKSISHVVEFIEKKVKTYTATTRIGIKFKVNSYNADKYILDSLKFSDAKLFTNGSCKQLKASEIYFSFKNDDYDDLGKLSFDINLEPAIAKKHYDNIEAVLAVRFYDYLDRDFDYSIDDASLDNPIDYTQSTYSIKAKIIKITYINKKTKDIVAELIF